MNLYHITLASNMDGIQGHGLRAVRGGALFAHGGYGRRSRGRVHLSDEEGVRFWHSRVGDMAFHNYDDAENHFPVLLRVEHEPDDLQPDEVGSRDSRAGAFYTESDIEPDDLVWWDGEDWRSLDEWDFEEAQEAGALVEMEAFEDDGEQWVDATFELPEGWDE